MVLEQSIFQITSPSYFKALALEVFKFQFEQNNLYREYCCLLKKNPDNVSQLNEIPFLPISFFKTHSIISSEDQAEITFTSSGTTGQESSKHLVAKVKLYQKSYLSSFTHFYPNWEQCAIIGLLPSYLERQGSSLIYMVNDLIQISKHPKSGFHLAFDADFLHFLQNDESPKIIIGVAYALCDLAEKNIPLKNTIIIETGGMKGQRKEIIREELHAIIQKGLQAKAIHSEYGMTELLSQAYFQGKNFECPTWMKVLVRDVNDPLSCNTNGKGALNIIDLANLYSCSFIATEDLGEVYPEGTFNVLGRMDFSQTRGCNLLV